MGEGDFWLADLLGLSGLVGGLSVRDVVVTLVVGMSEGVESQAVRATANAITAIMYIR